MENGQKSRKLLLVATVVTVLALSSVLVVFAAVLGTFNGNAVTVNNVASGTVTYSTDNQITWNANPAALNVTGSLYTRFELSTTSFTGTAHVTWQLQTDNSGWTNMGNAITTVVTLTGSSQTIYASSDGNSANNQNWIGTPYITTGGSYRVIVTVASG